MSKLFSAVLYIIVLLCNMLRSWQCVLLLAGETVFFETCVNLMRIILVVYSTSLQCAIMRIILYAYCGQWFVHTWYETNFSIMNHGIGLL